MIMRVVSERKIAQCFYKHQFFFHIRVQLDIQIVHSGGENNETMNEYSCNMHTRVFLFLIIVLEVLMLKI